MAVREVGIVMNGVTGRMGYNQHLVRSILAIRDQGGVELADGTRVVPAPLLVGRSEQKLRDIADRHGLNRWTTDLDTALSDPSTLIYFDAQTTRAREKSVLAAIAAGRHIYCEKPTSDSVAGALELVRAAREAGVKNGVVMDKVFLPGLRKLRRLVEGGFFGRILSVRGEFGYWVFEGDWQRAQRPSWNYRAEDGGGITLDMFCHWNYVLESIAGRVRAVTARSVTHIPQRWDEQGQAYEATADDAAYAIFELEDGTIAQLNSSWAVRVYRDELVEFQVDGTEGSAVAGLRNCRIQHRSTTPMPVWNPDLPVTEPFREQWQQVPDNAEYDNGFKAEWEQFLRHVLEEDAAPFPYDFLAAARGVQLAELGIASSREGRRIEVPEVGA
ncbi:Predicted dehydrogenase [Actinopolymorpha cephalotaxi]|uniref:Dehydrogenase n=1 Tax=Actinopolymorpha cephalotaxi TaxID=504797 RepID=A0A1I2LP10_9ACTN|nr:Gfo/Idh/MocA family oxidoreductase [Actinopolymorpha cephalotaxi]NYH81295.1 putative dehydrogenase [Actinopolymorpha cephalotaxi]SFF78801.1 Predicted dehydrogenase [Actinopolymorpha cephalotaxi]